MVVSVKLACSMIVLASYRSGRINLGDMALAKALGCLLLLLLPFTTNAGSLNVAVASNFAQPAKKLANAFETQSGHRLKLSFAASGKLYAQIKAGAPFGIFFSADQQKPALLEQQGLTVPGSRQTYAIGRLVLWAREKLPASVQTRLQTGQYQKLALANPKVAPYGKAAMQVLETLGLSQSSRARWVLGENISQTYQFVASGNADLGLIAYSQLLLSDRYQKGDSWVLPEQSYQAIYQDMVWLKTAKTDPVAQAFMRFLNSKAANVIIRSSGYSLAQNGAK